MDDQEEIESSPDSPPVETPEEKKRRLSREAQKKWRLAHPEVAAKRNLAAKRSIRRRRRIEAGLSPLRLRKKKATSTGRSTSADNSSSSTPPGPPELTVVTPETLPSTSIESSPISSGTEPSRKLLRRIESREEATVLAEQAGLEMGQYGRIQDPFVIEVLNRHQAKRNSHEENLFQAVKEYVKFAFGDDREAIAKATGMPRSKIAAMFRLRGRYKDPRLTEHQIQKEIEIQETVYSGRKDLIDRLLEGAARFTEQAIFTVGKTTGVNSAKSAAILLDKALLLAGQPTSRVSRVDERMMSSEDLEKKAREYDAMLSSTDLKLVQGGSKE